MAETPPFGPGRGPRDLTYDSALPGVANPLGIGLAPQAPFRKFQRFLALTIILGTVRTGNPIWCFEILCGWLHPAQWPLHLTWLAILTLPIVMCQCTCTSVCLPPEHRSHLPLLGRVALELLRSRCLFPRSRQPHPLSLPVLPTPF